jgi:hypothetical protein
MTRLSVLLVVLAAALVGASPAGAASVSYSAGTITYATAKDEANNVAVARWGFALKVTETGTRGKKASAITLTVGNGCHSMSSTTAACPGIATLVSADLGDGNDSFDGSLATVALDLTGGAGNDSFDTRNGLVDTLACGGDSDSGNADALDSVAADCEAVAKPAPAEQPNPVDPITDPVTEPVTDPVTDPITDPVAEPDAGQRGRDPQRGTGPDPGTSGDDPAPATTPAANSVPPTIPPQIVAIGAGGVARVVVVCPADSGGCAGTVAIELPPPAAGQKHSRLHGARVAKPVRLGRAKFTAAAGTSRTVPVRLSKRGRQRILRGHRSRARIVVSTRTADGKVAVATQDVTIKPAGKVKRRP